MRAMTPGLGLVVQFLDLVAQHFTLRDGHLLLAGLARLGSAQQLARAGAGDDDELEPVVFGCSLHGFLYAPSPKRPGLQLRRVRKNPAYTLFFGAGLRKRGDDRLRLRP